MPSESRALSDLTVLDLTQMLAGPFCTQVLADFGANVIKVESLDGDGTRYLGPFHPDDSLRAYGGYFQSVNRNKRSFAVDLKSEQGKELLLNLVERADVVVENFRAGTMERLELSYEKLKERNPKLVYAAIRGFGDPRSGESRYVDWPAYDIVAQAMGGILSVTGLEDGTPVKVGPGVGDLIPALFAGIGIMTAVHHAQKTGRGQFVDLSMVDCVLALCERIVYQNSILGRVPKPDGNRHPLFAPYGIFKAQDGWVVIGCPTQRFWQILCEIMNRPELLQDERFAENESRLRNVIELENEINLFTATKSKKELIDLFGMKIPFGPIFDVADMKSDPYFHNREMFIDVPHPGSERATTIAGIPVKMSETPGIITRRAPLLGEDTETVLAEIGYSACEISRLKKLSIIK